MKTPRYSGAHHAPGIFFALALAAMVIFSPRAAGFAGGDGTANNPYLVATAADLDAVRTNLSAHYRQTADINLGVAPWNTGEGWVPIGLNPFFSGTYDGGGFTINGLKINRPGAEYQGLFGNAADGCLENITIENAYISGGNYTGILAGSVSRTKPEARASVDRVKVSGTVTSNGDKVGGLIGQVYVADVVMRCMADVVVTGDRNVGGLVGLVQGGAIRFCSSRGEVSGSRLVGGLCGNGYPSFVRKFILSHSYSRAAVSVTGAEGGGLLGKLDGMVNHAYSTGTVTGGGTDLGGLVGKLGSGSVHDSYWDMESSGQATSAAGQGKTTAEMAMSATYSRFPVGSIWHIDEGFEPPVLRDLSHLSKDPPSVHPDSLPGSGTAEDPHLVANTSELYAMHHAPERHYQLSGGIDLLDAAVWNNGQGWNFPVPFTGGLDGREFIIRNLIINRPTESDQGLFGNATNAKLVNLRLEAASVVANGRVGLLAGTLTGENGEVRNVRVKGTVMAYFESAGGMIGRLGNARVLTSGAEVDIAGNHSFVGGLAGDTSGGTEIRMSYVRGRVRGTNGVGGLAGYHRGAGIANCWSSAAVEGVDEVGGLVGRVGDTYRGGYTISGVAGHIHTSVSSGLVIGTGEFTGGLIGKTITYPGDWVFSVTRDCFWDKERSGQAESAAGSPLTTAEFRRRASYPATYNFTSLWQFANGGGDPIFQEGTMERQTPPRVIGLDELPGEGTSESPYLISNALQLNAMRNGLDQNYRLVNDIDLRDCMFWNAGHGWAPVGDSEPFVGTLDGAGHAIRFLTISRGMATNRLRYTGLFASTNGARIQQVHIMNADVSGGSSTGGLIGEAVNTEMYRVSYSGELIGGTASTGGLVGNASGGGLVIRESYSLGSVSGELMVGGLVGHLHGDSKSGVGGIYDSFSRCSVQGTDEVGGIVGKTGERAANYSTTAGHARSSYSAGRVMLTPTARGLGEVVGGLVGQVWGYNNVQWTNNYWDIEVTGQPESYGGTGVNTADMTHPHGPGVFTGWDFSTVWEADTTQERNGGYPFHRGQLAKVWLDYIAGGGGRIMGEVSQHIPLGNDGTSVEAVPNPGYVFIGWSDGSMTNPRTDTNVTTGLSFTARFERVVVEYTLRYNAGSNGSLLGVQEQVIEQGSNGTPVRAVPNPGYAFSRWSDGSVANPRTDTGVNADLVVTALFERVIVSFTLRYAAGANGSITGTVEQVVEAGAGGTPVSAVPDAGHRFVEWSDGSTANPRTDTDISADLSVRAVFAPVVVTYSLKYEAGANGRVTGVPEQVVEAGTSGTAVTAVPNSGYRFVGWSDGSAANPRTDVNVYADLRVSALFEPEVIVFLRPEIAVQQGKGAGKELKDNKSSRDFGVVKVKKSSKPMVFTIKNTGTASLKKVKVTLSGKQAKDFKVVKQPSKSVKPGKSTQFTVVFKPGKPATSKALLKIASNDKDENPFRVKIAGKGTR